jgi:translation elongation factor EF-Tu-like GTPase
MRTLPPMFRMTVSDVFSIRGRGTVATGKVEAGTVRVGDTVFISGRQARVDGIEAFRKILETANVGDNIGMLFKALDKDDVKAGDVITGDPAAPADVPPPPSSTEFPDIGLT